MPLKARCRTGRTVGLGLGLLKTKETSELQARLSLGNTMTHCLFIKALFMHCENSIFKQTIIIQNMFLFNSPCFSEIVAQQLKGYHILINKCSLVLHRSVANAYYWEVGPNNSEN